MNFSDIQPGQYVAHITDWGLEEVPQLNNKLKVVISFSIEVSGLTAEFVSGRWAGLLETKDGLPNKNTIKTLVTCGFTGNDPIDLTLKSDALDKDSPFQVTIIRDGKFNRIQWVNSIGLAPRGIKKIKTVKKASEKMRMAFQEALTEQGIDKRPKAQEPGRSNEEELGF